MKYLLPLLLFGCAYQPTHELEDQLFACDNAKAIGCEELREELNARYDAIERREKREAEKECPVGVKCYYGEDARELMREIEKWH